MLHCFELTQLKKVLGFYYKKVLKVRILGEQTGKHKGHAILAAVLFAFMPTHTFPFDITKMNKEKYLHLVQSLLAS